MVIYVVTVVAFLVSWVVIVRTIEGLRSTRYQSYTKPFDQDEAPGIFPETLVVAHDLPWRVVSRKGLFLVIAADGRVITTCSDRTAAKQIIRKAGVLSGELKLFARLARQPGDNNVR